MPYLIQFDRSREGKIERETYKERERCGEEMEDERQKR